MWASFGGTSASTSAVAPAAAADVVATMRGTVARANAKTAPEDHRKVANSDIAVAPDDDKDWRWFDGDLNEYYNKLERDEHAKRKPDVITTYAVHRWMGPDHSTLIHYELIRGAIYEVVLGEWPKYLGKNLDGAPSQTAGGMARLRVFDAGCGLGAGLMWFDRAEPSWDLVGHTISEEQYKWIVEDLPEHAFEARLRTYDEPLGDASGADREASRYDAVYSIEASIHSLDLNVSIGAWADALNPGGAIVIIDDFLSVGIAHDDPDVDLFAKSWIANSVHTTSEVAAFAEKHGMELVRDRDLGSEYQIIRRNYRNKVPELTDEQGRAHQGWLGSKVRQRLMVQGKITYRMVVLQKKGDGIKKSIEQSCDAVPALLEGDSSDTMIMPIDPVLMSGRGNDGGDKMACISGWYCCNKGLELFESLETNRTKRTSFLQLPKDLFGHYLTSFSNHLTDFYNTFPKDYPSGSQKKGAFLDIGGTGSVASGMTQVTNKFSHFAGPLEYWVLDSDPSAEKVTQAIVCDVDDCPKAPTCGYDVTFSHTVLEHASRPWEAFDTIARITKKGGLTLHLVPWSYQYHATPDDNYRFSHQALTSLLEDRGFEVLDVGYDVCTQPDFVRENQKDEHFETIWLTYVVGRKL